MKARLVSPASSPPEWEIELEEFPAVIGRSPEAAIQTLDVSVSQRHCELEEIDGRLMVRDLGSKNGTFVNGVQIEIAPLLPGDKLTVGQASFVAAYEPPTATARPRIPGESGFPVLERKSPEDVTFVHLVDLLERQRRVFREQYRRDARQGGPAFPNPPHPEHIEHLLVEEMKQDGVAPQFIYAFEKTGILVTEFNYDTASSEQLAEWQAAVEEYELRHGNWDSDQRFPIGAITMYGPDKNYTTMIVAAVIPQTGGAPLYRRWVGNQVAIDERVKRAMTEFFRDHGVRSVIHVRENVGCPHYEGLDYPVGDECPFCPYWQGKQGPK